nr:HAMP domain-containing sensor histidine kinase [uncultured Desulfobulbus sp.]
MQRAAELVSSFKQVAADQTSAARRRFNLQDMVEDVLLTLQPTLKRTVHRLHADIAEDITLESYPGVIGQILTNLITNALMHAWASGDSGNISVLAQRMEEDILRLSVADNGSGIAESLKKKIFEPFFTTAMGRGGTGLGLNIAYNSARNVLGGVLLCEDGETEGAVFHLDIPLHAPHLNSNEQDTIRK